MNGTWKWLIVAVAVVMTGATVWSVAQAADEVADAPAAQPATVPSAFAYELPKDGLTSAGVYDDKGALVRVLWQATTRPAGKHEAAWDGMTDFKQPAGPGKYEVRVAFNEVAAYHNVAVIGNTYPSRQDHIQHGVSDMCVDAAGRIYTANGWEEDGHDFKVFNPDGTTAFHARYQIRNGNPNGAPYSIAIDDKYIYVGMEGWMTENDKNKQMIQRFTIDRGNRAPFTDEALVKNSNGHIQIYEWPRKLIPEGTDPEIARMMHYPLKAVAIRGDEILCADVLGGKIHRFNKVTGVKTGAFDVTLPHAMTVDSKGNIWVGHERSKVSVFSIEGKLLGTPITDAGHVKALKTGPGNKLILTDSQANIVRVYEMDGVTAKQVSTFGSPAKPGDSAPDKFYKLTAAAMNADGGMVTAQNLTTTGLRIARFDDKGKLLWEQMGLEFCSIGNYGRHNPDEVITQVMHRIKLDRKNDKWTYAGTILAGEPRYIRHPHGVPRIMMIDGKEFFFQAYGDGMQVYRRDKDGLLHLASLVGGINPFPDGSFNDDAPQDKKKGQGKWSWSDLNGDGVVDADEVVTHKEFGAPGVGYAVFGMNVDARGDILFCDHHLWGISELPRSGVDKRGNPTYDWSKERLIVKRDESPARIFPLMAVRAEDGSIYAIGRVEQGSVFERATRQQDGYMWMGGELLAKFDKDGNRQWVIRLPHKCTGLDVVPVTKNSAGGVATGYYEYGVLYQINPEGLIIGTAKPGDAAGNYTGWLDTTGSVAASRDKDGVLDFFIEDSLLNRFMWYRGDDKDVKTIKVTVERK